MNRTDRLYALVEELRAVAPGSRSARQLVRKFEVSPRTIERDILALQEAGVPIYARSRPATPGTIRGECVLESGTASCMVPACLRQPGRPSRSSSWSSFTLFAPAGE